MKLSKKLRLLREEARKTQEQLRNETGLGIQTIRNYENDNLDKYPNTYQLKILKDYFGVTYEYLLDENCNNKTPETVEVGKLLNLSDSSLDRIKELQNHKQEYFPNEGLYYRDEIHGDVAFDNWLSSFDELKRFSIRLTMLENLNKIMETSKYFMNMLEYREQIENSHNTDKVFVTKLNTLLSKKLEELNKCFNNHLEADFIIEDYSAVSTYYSEYLNYLKENAQILPEGLSFVLDDLSVAAFGVYEDAYKNIKYCQYEISEMIKNSISKQCEVFDKDSIPSEIETLLNQIDSGGN